MNHADLKVRPLGTYHNICHVDGCWCKSISKDHGLCQEHYAYIKAKQKEAMKTMTAKEARHYLLDNPGKVVEHESYGKAAQFKFDDGRYYFKGTGGDWSEIENTRNYSLWGEAYGNFQVASHEKPDSLHTALSSVICAKEKIPALIEALRAEFQSKNQ